MTDSPKKPVRVRFAPSPTGYFHIGSARTVLFNWLFAKQHNGVFILRIEDTDAERSKREYEKDILEGIKWLGLNWDEGPGPKGQGTRDKGQGYIGDYGPYRQSERLDIYEKYLIQLLQEHKAYWCFCAKEQLESDRQAMLAQGMAPKYSGHCRSLSPEEAEDRLKKGEPAVIRFRMHETEVEFHDLIRGKVKFDASLFGDIVIAKSLNEPLYNFSAVVDDALMKITHVIRGEDHLSNTPKQILLQSALGFEEIKFAHLPLILAPDRSKLSKRHLETSVTDYKNEGYLPDAIENFLVLLGWHPIHDREILNRDELVREFDLKRVQKAGAVFDIEKLNWLNAHYIKTAKPSELAKQLKNFVPKEWLKQKELLRKSLEIEKERIDKLSDFKNLAGFFFELPGYDVQLLAWPRTAALNKEKALANLKILVEEINKIFKADFNKDNLEKAIMPLTEVWGRGDLLWPLRVALSGQEASPGPFEIMDTLGKEETLKRMNLAIRKLE